MKTKLFTLCFSLLTIVFFNMSCNVNATPNRKPTYQPSVPQQYYPQFPNVVICEYNYDVANHRQQYLYEGLEQDYAAHLSEIWYCVWCINASNPNIGPQSSWDKMRDTHVLKLKQLIGEYNFEHGILPQIPQSWPKMYEMNKDTIWEIP